MWGDCLWKEESSKWICTVTGMVVWLGKGKECQAFSPERYRSFRQSFNCQHRNHARAQAILVPVIVCVRVFLFITLWASPLLYIAFICYIPTPGYLLGIQETLIEGKYHYNVGHFKSIYCICYNIASVAYVLCCFFACKACGKLDWKLSLHWKAKLNHWTTREVPGVPSWF